MARCATSGGAPARVHGAEPRDVEPERRECAEQRDRRERMDAVREVEREVGDEQGVHQHRHDGRQEAPLLTPGEEAPAWGRGLHAQPRWGDPPQGPLRDQLDGCIGCGCLSLTACPLRNPDDALAAQGPGARLLDEI